MGSNKRRWACGPVVTAAVSSCAAAVSSCALSSVVQGAGGYCGFSATYSTNA